MPTLAFKDGHDGYYQIEISDGAPLPDWVSKLTPVDIVHPQLTVQQMQAMFIAAIQLRLDDFARQRNYDNILSACTYATSTVPKFKTEGQACVNLRDATWAAAYDILAKVQAGQRPMPTSIADIEADLPALEWPQ